MKPNHFFWNPSRNPTRIITGKQEGTLADMEKTVTLFCAHAQNKAWKTKKFSYGTVFPSKWIRKYYATFLVKKYLRQLALPSFRKCKL